MRLVLLPQMELEQVAEENAQMVREFTIFAHANVA
jgi:hypothetical protein